MATFNFRLIIRIFGLLLIVLSIIFLFTSYENSQLGNCVFPIGSELGGIDVSNLDQNQAKIILMSKYEKPILIKNDEFEVELSIDELGFSINYESMIEELNCDQEKPIDKYWNYLWGNDFTSPIKQDLDFVFQEERFHATIKRLISSYFEKSISLPQPILGTTRYYPGENGVTVNKEALDNAIKNQLLSSNRTPISVDLIEVNVPSPEGTIIKEKIKEIILDSQFNGVVEVYAHQLSRDKTVQLLMWNGEEKQPGVAFTAASTMKIPILLSTYWRNDLPLNENLKEWIEEMIVYSENDPADRLMEQMDPVRGPLLVTSDMKTFGLENTFIAGYFYLGAPLLDLIQTPANQRNDAFVDPDVYNQTTPEDIGKLLVMVYQCAEDNNADLIQKTQGLISSPECQEMIEVLSKNKMGALIEAGLPEGTKIAHKHGWSQERDGLVHSFSDVAIVFGPESDFVITIFLYSQNQLLFDQANPLIARISQSVFNAYNLNHQISWPFQEN